TNDAISTPIRLVDMGAPRYMAAMSILAVLAQRLVRLVCEGCAEPYTLQPFEREWLKLELGEAVDQHTYMHGHGCSSCNATGYLGRVAIYEMLEMNNELTEAANHQDPNHFIKVARQHMDGQTMRKHAVDMVLAKRTTVAEAMRISNQFED
ncbi:MAG TPA: MSHA biogenesis protein MshE, partial [Methylophilaceae bacterium]|nr:MSHA biogenesis protein MshE [Methylophilaceae bacterium]